MAIALAKLPPTSPCEFFLLHCSIFVSLSLSFSFSSFYFVLCTLTVYFQLRRHSRRRRTSLSSSSSSSSNDDCQSRARGPPFANICTYSLAGFSSRVFRYTCQLTMGKKPVRRLGLSRLYYYYRRERILTGNKTYYRE